ncbi:MAG TPA: CGNR zinc finger domain-containing protein [Pseudonocardiaceae bacterium]|nr:CGNR zinc finger domain-containing protein [Pseudonocardiaceae bacterium]
MTGQVDFDSHTSGVVLAAVDTVNVLAPGWSRGRQYLPPTGAELDEQVRAALAGGSRRGDLPILDGQLAELAELLTELRVMFFLLDAEDLDGACELLNKMISDLAAVPTLSRHDGEPWHLHFHAPDAAWAAGWAGSMATGLAMVLGSPMHDRLGVCSAPACDRVYVDTSRNGARRFCSTACQNRVKAATFRERERQREQDREQDRSATSSGSPAEG